MACSNLWHNMCPEQVLRMRHWRWTVARITVDGLTRMRHRLALRREWGDA